MSAPAEAGCDATPASLQSLAARRIGAAPARVLAPGSAAAYPMYAWPLGQGLHDGLIVRNYADNDPSNPGIRDFMGGTATYDEHAGTDFMLYNFRLMDRGCTIRAATSGTVLQVTGPANYDRHCAVTFPVSVNSILLGTADNTCTDYYHLRANSVTVQVGEQVQAGQMLGLVGSSGQSSGPHLHLQPWNSMGARDPYSGPSNPLPSLWIEPQDYDADNPLWYTDLGVFSAAEVGGNLANTSHCHAMNRLQQPVAYGLAEAQLAVFAQFQSRGGDLGRIEVRRPNATLFGSYDFTSTQQQLGFFWVSWNWSGNVNPADYGTWTVRAFSNGAHKLTIPFQVGPETVFGPRFWPRAGRSFRINGAVQRDTLRHSPLGGPVSFALIDAPAFVTLTQDSIITIAATSTQANRSLFFRALMTDGAARTDTAWYHVVDMSKPHGFPVDVGPAPALLDLELALAGPSPFAEGTSLRYGVATAARVWLGIYDLRGRLVRTLVDGELAPAGVSVTRSWDGRDGEGLALPGGIYFARLQAGGARRVLKIARLP